jgi:hypothetical protein
MVRMWTLHQMAFTIRPAAARALARPGEAQGHAETVDTAEGAPPLMVDSGRS